MHNISRSKGTQTIKFSRLMKYNIRNISLAKSYAKCDTETFPRPFCKNSKSNMSLDQPSETLYSLYKPKLRSTKIYWNEGADHLLYLAFSKTKRVLKIFSLPDFLHNFLRKLLLSLYSINWLNYIALFSLLLEILQQNVLKIFFS